MTIINNKRERGFTIVELLVVIVVIGVLAAITIVSYTGITSKANTSSGQSYAASTLAKAGTYAADGPTSTWPTSFASLTSAASTTTYFLPAQPQDFTLLSNGVVGAPGRTMTTPFRALAGLTYNNDSLDYVLCGTSGTTTAPASYSAITIPSGVKIGYWDFLNGAINLTDNVAGVTTGNYPTGSSNPVACFKVGIGEAAAAVAKAIAADTTGGYYPYQNITATFTAGGTAAKLPTGVSVSNTTDPASAAAGLTGVHYQCLTSCNATMTGARILYWDYANAQISTTANAIYLGTATSGGSFVNSAT